MKEIKLNSYTVNIDAINPSTKKPIKDQTMYFLNELSIVYRQAAEFNRGNGWNRTANEYENNAGKIYDLLCIEGFFDNK